MNSPANDNFTRGPRNLAKRLLWDIGPLVAGVLVVIFAVRGGL